MTTEANTQTIGTRLRRIREHLGETQEVFAGRFGLSRDDIANYERGRCDLPTRLLVELDQLGFNIRWILNGCGNMRLASAREESIPSSEDRETVSLEDLAYSQMIQTEALTRLLVKKGIFSKQEFLDDVKAVNEEQHEKAGKVGMG